MQPYFEPTRKMTSQKTTFKKMQNRRRPQKEMEDDLNFKAVLLRLFNYKTSKTNGFDTIEIDLVLDRSVSKLQLLSKVEQIRFVFKSYQILSSLDLCATAVKS